MAQIDGTFPPGAGAIFTVQIAVDPDFEDWLRQTGQVVPSPISVQAKVDTGADETLITPRIVSQLGLYSADKALITDVAGRVSICTKYDVRMQLCPGLVYTVSVIESPFSILPVECLIGCDLLARGTFLYDGPRGQFRLTF